jgi:hypothetical protein
MDKQKTKNNGFVKYKIKIYGSISNFNKGNMDNKTTCKPGFKKNKILLLFI